MVRIDHVLNPKTRLIDTDIAASGEPLQGAAFRAEIQVGELKGWLVPRDAVLNDEQGEYLFQVAAGKARRVEVKRLGGDERTSVVDGKLDEKLPLVIEGNYQLGDGMAVRSAAAPVENPDADKADAPAEKAGP
ncbi:MAG: hypothetical protein JOY51_03165 [Nevskia sp.]|nr:hypothetical protein [Nevskia sp.]